MGAQDHIRAKAAEAKESITEHPVAAGIGGLAAAGARRGRRCRKDALPGRLRSVLHRGAARLRRRADGAPP